MPSKGRRFLVSAASVAGAVVRATKATLPGVAGAVAVCWGCALIWPPLAFLAAGGFLLVLDRRLS